jgi:hypothetical protein
MFQLVTTRQTKKKIRQEISSINRMKNPKKRTCPMCGLASLTKGSKLPFAPSIASTDMAVRTYEHRQVSPMRGTKVKRRNTHGTQHAYSPRASHNQCTHSCTKCCAIQDPQVLLAREREGCNASNLQGLWGRKEGV